MVLGPDDRCRRPSALSVVLDEGVVDLGGIHMARNLPDLKTGSGGQRPPPDGIPDIAEESAGVAEEFRGGHGRREY
jgi:hypothetical protein